ncbi:hypothetical protein OA327_01125 [Flavobacteriales bacterium]|nr:hypothetical protein [Flavobacteriales bacterium]
MRIIFFALIVYSCNNNINLPKQKAYFAPEFEIPTYKKISLDCNYSFNINSQSSINNIKNCNYEIYYKNLNAKIFINQIVLSNSIERVVNTFNQKINENSRLSDQIIQSDYINVDKKIYSKLYSFVGNSPSNIQFYVTNQTDKFLTGSLFFETKPNYDSLFPYIDYIRNDIKKMVDSFRWIYE